jgi:predicted ATPase/class 3 adenylate cyclase
MPNYPSGTVTFLFTDIEGSTALWEGDRQAMAAAVERHLTLLRTAIEVHGGVLFKTVGDAVQAAFPTAPDAVAAAVQGQQALLAEDWKMVGTLQVRMALHAGEAIPDERGDYLAAPLNRLSRLLLAGHGGQILLTQTVQQLARSALADGIELRDLGFHRLRDLLEPERVFQLLHPDLPADFPPIQTLATQPNNLPLQPTPCVGRADQVARIVDLLSRDAVRLLTITGPGGVGKTRLALQCAAELLEVFPDGVWFVDLSALDDPSLVPSAIAAVLGVRGLGGDLTHRLAGVLGGKRLLLVLDNFERVVKAAPFVADLLTLTPDVEVLITSRTPLHAYGEREYPLSPLPLPDPDHLPSVEQLSQYDAVRLFIEQAQAVKPDFAVTDANAHAVAEICRRLDGLPLAIELAAACIKVLPPQALLKRLERRLPLLTGGARTLPARQQTMRDAIAWSHDLLTAEEQAQFRGLAIFPGGCRLDAAEAVVGGEGALDVYAGIAALVDKSLLRQEEDAEGEPRFRMLETIREYGLERLEASGKAEGMMQRLALWYLGLAETAQPHPIGALMPADWKARLDDELPNLRAIVNWLLERGEATRALRLLAATSDYWFHRHNSNVELRRWLEVALAAAPDAPATDRALGHWLLAIVSGILGNHEDALLQAQHALTMGKESSDPAPLGLAHYAVGLVWEYHNDGDRAAAAYAEAVPLLKAAGNDVWTWFVQAELGDILVWRGDVLAAVPLLETALVQLHKIRSADWFVLNVINARGHAALRQSDLSLAVRCYTGNIDVARNLQDTRTILGAVVGLAGVALALHQADQAARLLGAVEAARERAGIVHIVGSIHVERMRLDVRAALEPAAFERAWSAGRELMLEEAVAEALAVADEVANEPNS